jgi:hypothetical protein
MLWPKSRNQSNRPIPKNGANKKIWARFYEKFVLLCDWKEYIKNK